MNEVKLEGNLARDITLYQTAKGKSFCFMTIAVERTAKMTDFISVKVWDELAQSCGETLIKGDRVRIVGRVTINTQERDGKKESSTVIVADEVGRVARTATDKNRRTVVEVSDEASV